MIRSLRALLLCGLITVGIDAIGLAQSGFDVYRFPKGGHRGFGPQSGLVADSVGDLYGTTQYGGTGNCTNYNTKGWTGCGTVFRLTPPSTMGGVWTQTVLYNFQGSNDGAYPYGGVIFDGQGRLYGTTFAGGLDGGGGTVFQLTAGQNSTEWIESILFSFPANFGSSNPSGNLTFDKTGNLFGSVGFFAYYYGDCPDIVNCFGVFELSPSSNGSWTGAFLPNNGNYFDGLGPTGGLVIDQSGNLYGMTNGGGTSGVGQCSDLGCGVVFQMSPPAVLGGEWSVSQLHIFDNGTGDGIAPMGSLISDRQGNLYGTTQWGGTGGTCWGFATDGFCGTVFELSPDQKGGWTETILYNFKGGADGSLPSGTLGIDDQGNLYGTTGAGGQGNCSYPYFTDVGGCGSVFKLTKPDQGGSWTKTTLATFNGGNGQFPIGQLLFAKGALYGTTIAGGQKCPMGQNTTLNPTCGTVFKIAF